MSLHWSSPEHAFSGVGDLQRFEPGVGDDRYHDALTWLIDTGREVALASFTFDPAREGSVVVAPEHRAPNPEAVDRRARAVVTDPGRTSWENGYQVMREELANGVVDKVVLARRVVVSAATTIDVDAVFARLCESNPHTYVFAIEGLVGASPELLVSVTDGKVRSVALAGTATGTDLLDDHKTILEHQLAADSVAEGLSPHVRRLAGHRSVMEVGRIRHLATSFEGDLNHGLGIMDLLATLHPTAAVAGTPTAQAMELIRVVEPIDRGRYAGPVGWFDAHGNGELAIALRCGIVSGGEAVLYAGGGLVAGSDRLQEWAETEAKLRPMLEALGVE